jgi:uncharacterized protein (TIGR02145 family)
MAGSASSSANPSGVRGVCPPKWHLPSDAEWKQLEIVLGMTQAQADQAGWRGSNQGVQMKYTSGWNSNGKGSNSCGFSGLPGGYHITGSFIDIGNYGVWWSCTLNSSNNAWFRDLGYNQSGLYRKDDAFDYGFSIRCIRDN